MDLSQAGGVIATTLQLPNNARPEQEGPGSLGDTFGSATQHLADLHVWEIEEWAHSLWVLGTFGGLAAGAGAVALATDRRRMVGRLGWALAGGGGVIVGVLVFLHWYVGQPIADDNVAAAVRDAVGRWTGDLRTIGLWMAGYGVVLAAAAASVRHGALTPARATTAVGGWVERGGRRRAVQPPSGRSPSWPAWP